MKTILSVLMMCLLLSVCPSMAEDGSPTQRPNDWLLNAENDRARFELLQQYLRGFDQPMWEVGERYTAIFHALERGNFKLAAYHWEKIRTTIVNGFLKRPAREANAQVFLNTTWDKVRQMLVSGDVERAWEGFVTARTACMRCHLAESVPYMNDQPVFDLTRGGCNGGYGGIDGLPPKPRTRRRTSHESECDQHL